MHLIPMEKHSLLDAHTPEAIIKQFSDLSNCTAEMVELIKNTGQNDLRKARQVFLKVDNYEMGEIYELTRAGNRVHRQNSTYVVLSKMRALCRKRCEFKEIEEMYNSVFCVRSRDTYAVIRGMCVEFLVSWVIDNELLWKKEYLRHLVWGLEDRSELVRKKALRGVLKIFNEVSKRNKIASEVNSHSSKHRKNSGSKRIKISNIKHNMDATGTKSNACGVDPSIIQSSNLTTTTFYEQCGEKILEMTEEETGNIAKLAREIVYFVFARLGCIEETQVLSVLARDTDTGRWRSEALQRLCPGGVFDIDRLHEIASRVGGRALRGLCTDSDEVAQLVMCIGNYIADGRCDGIKEHEKKLVCLLEVLAEQQLEIDPGIFEQLFHQTKDSSETTAAIIECLAQVSTLCEHGGETRRLLKIVEQRVFQRPKLITHFIKLLRAAEKDFHQEVIETVERLKATVLASNEFRAAALLPLVRAYDVTDIVDDTAGSVVKCYAALWLIYAGNFQRVAEVRFMEVDDFLTLTEFLVFFYNHANIGNAINDDSVVNISSRLDNTNTITSAANDAESILVDKTSCLRLLFQRLYDLLQKNPQFNNEAACLQLYKLVSIGLFVDHAHLLFEICSSDAINWFVASTSSVAPLLHGFFKAAVSATHLHQYARPLALKCLKNKISLLSLVRQYITHTTMLEHILPYFVSALTVNECIVLEGLVKSSKFKTACLRKINANAARLKENVTVI